MPIKPEYLAEIEDGSFETCEINERLLTPLYKNEFLKSLNLSSCGLNNTNVKNFLHYNKTLKQLDVSQNNITDECLENISTCKLSYMNLSNTNISDASIDMILNNGLYIDLSLHKTNVSSEKRDEVYRYLRLPNK